MIELASLAATPPALLAVLAVLAVVQVVLDLVALIDLYRRPTSEVVTGNKWIWVAIIVLVNILGAILYFAIGRRPPPAAEPERAPGQESERVEKIVDSLYGPPADPPKQ